MANIEETFSELVKRLQAAHGAALVSVVLHGAGVSAPANAQKSDYNALVVTDSLPAEELRRARPVARWWVESGFALPVYITASEFKQSLDVFPIEFRQMKQAYRVLHGQDLLAGEEASKANLRLQTEYELRGKLLRLRALYLPAGESRDSLVKLMTDSIVSFAQFLRPILEIIGEEPPPERAATVRRAGELLKLDLAPLDEILALRDGQLKLDEAAAHRLFARYLDCVAQVIQAVNHL